MKRLAIFLLLPLAACQVARQPRKPTQYSIEQFMKTTRVFGSDFSRDEKSILFSSDQTGILNAWSVAVTGGAAHPVTQSAKESTVAVSFFPNDARVLYSQDQGGNEKSHLFVLEGGGNERDLTPGANVKAMFVGWSGDLKSFFHLTNERDPKFFDLYKTDATTYQRRLLYKDTTGYQLGDISRDEKWIAFSKPNTTSDSDIYLYDVAARRMKHITPHQGDISFQVASFDVPARYLYYLTDEGSDFAYLARYELATGKKEQVEKAGWDIVFNNFSWNGKYRVVGINEDARTRIKIYETATGQEMALPKLPANGLIRGVDFSRSEKWMAFYFDGDREPRNLYVYDLAAHETRRLTNTLNPEIEPADLVDSAIVRFKSFDGLQIPGLLYKPRGLAGKAPALVMVHGGPGGQAQVGYSFSKQFLVNHGYVVLDVNNRGSSGYGKKFFTADDRKHGHEPLWDCVEAKNYLASQAYVDPKRIGIIGGSYGGYMTLAALTLKPDEFAVGVDMFGISNWIRTLEAIPPWWESFRKALYTEIGDPKTDRKMLLEISPLFHAKNIKKPLMVLQGANDPRVLKVESDEIVQAAKANGVPVEYIVFDDEGHGFQKKANEIRAWQGILGFLDKYLKGAV